MRRIDLKLNAMVERIALDGQRAKGVVWTDKGGRHTSHASREVVICAGTSIPAASAAVRHRAADLLKENGIEVVLTFRVWERTCRTISVSRPSTGRR